MKPCTKCKRELPLDSFSKSSKRPDGRQTACRECASQYYKARYHGTEAERERSRRNRNTAREKRRAILQQAKDVPCADCGVKYPYYVMDFDHLDANEKSFQIGRAANYQTEAKILEEIAKCDVVCANCHRVRTYDRMNYA